MDPDNRSIEEQSLEPSSVVPPRGGALSGAVGLILSIILLGSAGFLTYRALSVPPPMEPDPVPIICMCAETEKLFTHKPAMGEMWPVYSPFTQRKTGYPVETCYWTKDNKRKLEPTYVILNEFRGKEGETICPDCGRIVVGHNPPPPPGVPMVEPTSAPTPADESSSPSAVKTPS